LKLNHLGIAVKSLKDAVPVFEKIFGVKATELEYVGVKATELEYVEEQKVNVRKLHLENIDIELLEGTSPESPISKFIEKVTYIKIHRKKRRRNTSLFI